MAKWIVHVNGRNNEGGFEMSVLKNTNIHGQQSWGWDDPREKIILFETGDKVSSRLFKKMRAFAEDVAVDANKNQL